MTNPFFFFGCWNNERCFGEIDMRMTILKALESDQNNFDFGIIGGDNVYSQGENKAYYKSTITSGFNALGQATKQKPKHVILGNHNAVNQSVTNAQKAYTDDIFKLYEEIATYESIHNYGFIFLNTNKFNDDTSLFNAFSSELQKNVSSRLFIVGHEPLIAAKSKKGNKFVNVENANIILDLCFKYMKKHKDKQVYYLCADVHNFQVLSVKKYGFARELPIIVVGTGGADPDLCIFDNISYYNKTTTISINGAKYNVSCNHFSHPFGYCIIKESKNLTIDVTYKGIGNDVTNKSIGFDDRTSKNLKSKTQKIINLKMESIEDIHLVACPKSNTDILAKKNKVI